MLKRVASVALRSFAHRLIYFGSARGETLTVRRLLAARAQELIPRREAWNFLNWSAELERVFGARNVSLDLTTRENKGAGEFRGLLRKQWGRIDI